MARGRDLEVNLISNADQFDLEQPADEMDQLGDAAKGTGKKVERAMEDISDASRQMSRKVDKDFDRAAKGADDFKNEASQSGREAAASFSGGFEDIQDFIQETAANAFGGFGPAGAAAGLAAAAGIGFVVNAINSANERVKELAQGLLDLKLDPQLNTDAGRIRQVLEELTDAGDLDRFRRAAREAGIDWNLYVRALANGGPEASRVRSQLAGMIDGFGGAEAVLTGTGRAANDLSQRLREQLAAQEQATGSADAFTEGLAAITRAEEEAADAAERHAQNVEAIQGAFDRVAATAGDLTAVVQEQAQAQADATEDPKDSWDDYAETVRLSAADVAGTLNAQTKALEEFRANMLIVQQRGDEEFLAWVSQQPANVAAAYAKGTAAERQTIYDAFRRNVGARQAAGVAAGMTEGKPAVVASAQGVHDAAAAALRVPVVIPTDVSKPTQAAIASVVASVRSALGVLSVPVRPVVGSVYIPNQYAMRPTP